MRKQAVLLSLFVVVATIGTLHHFALTHYWYWTIWWIDVVMHTLGGVAIGLAALWFLVSFRDLGQYTAGSVFVAVFGAALVVGVGWELFEFFAQLFVQGNFFPDTLYDILSDVAGGLIVYTYYYGTHTKTLSAQAL